MRLEDHSNVSFNVLQQQLPAIQAALREGGLDGWLLYDLHARNPVAGRLLALGELSRRYFVLVPAEGDPVALAKALSDAFTAAMADPELKATAQKAHRPLAPLDGDQAAAAVKKQLALYLRFKDELKK